MHVQPSESRDEFRHSDNVEGVEPAAAGIVVCCGFADRVGIGNSIAEYRMQEHIDRETKHLCFDFNSFVCIEVLPSLDQCRRCAFKGGAKPRSGVPREKRGKNATQPDPLFAINSDQAIAQSR